MLATLSPGCGSSQSIEPPKGTAVLPGPDKLLKPEDLYRYEGEGTAKRKVAIGRKERRQLLHDAAKKTE